MRRAARVLAPLPFALTWIDSRDGVFPPDVAPGVVCEHSDPVQAAVPGLAPGSEPPAPSREQVGLLMGDRVIGGGWIDGTEPA